MHILGKQQRVMTLPATAASFCEVQKKATRMCKALMLACMPSSYALAVSLLSDLVMAAALEGLFP